MSAYWWDPHLCTLQFELKFLCLLQSLIKTPHNLLPFAYRLIYLVFSTFSSLFILELLHHLRLPSGHHQLPFWDASVSNILIKPSFSTLEILFSQAQGRECPSLILAYHLKPSDWHLKLQDHSLKLCHYSSKFLLNECTRCKSSLRLRYQKLVILQLKLT